MLLIFQDSSLGSFEGEPGVSTESLSEAVSKSPRKPRKQRPVTSSGTGAAMDPLYAQVSLKIYFWEIMKMPSTALLSFGGSLAPHVLKIYNI